MAEPITNTITAIASKPITGIAITINTTILWLMGLLTPYLAFIALTVGAAAAILSFINGRKEKAIKEQTKKINELQIELLEKQLNDSDQKK